jgi:hypothetical protein
MKRKDFIKNLTGIYALRFIQEAEVKQFQKVYLKHFFVRGFQYYEGPTIIDEINSSGLIEMVREPENPVDKRAIALYFNKKKIGFVPRESNKTISILMDTELLEFHSEITHIRPEASHWEQIRVAVYALKEIKQEADWKKIEPYAVLKTPTYHSIRSEEDTLTRIYYSENLEEDDDYEDEFEFWDEDEFENEEDFDSDLFNYEEDRVYSSTSLKLNGSNEEKPALFHTFENIKELEEALNKEQLIQNNFPDFDEIKEDILISELLSRMNNSLELQEKTGIFSINIHKLMDKKYQIKGVNLIEGKHGKTFFEVVFELVEEV